MTSTYSQVPLNTDAPDAIYVTRLLDILRREHDGLHNKITEIERIRFGEGDPSLPKDEAKAGYNIRIGLAAELIENVKASFTSSYPTLHVEGHRTGDAANRNNDKREKFWSAYLRDMNYPTPILSELLDSQAGLGIGVLKGVCGDWPKEPRQRKAKEGDKAYLQRVKALKRGWGPPFEAITVHPLSYFFRRGKGSRVVESIEHSWKPRLEMFRTYGIKSESDLISRSDLQLGEESMRALIHAATTGTPETFVKPFPAGLDTTTLALVTEYWSPEWYQVYMDRRLIYQTQQPPVNYFIGVGRTTVSQDPDKFGISVAEYHRWNEPVINRMLSRMAEAAELIVKKRLTIEMPEGGIAGIELSLEDDQEVSKPKQYTFKADAAEALEPGAKVVDPFKDAAQVYQAMPMVTMLIDLMNQHGVSPIFKGQSPGAAGSGYRDNSLYLMAKSQYQYIGDQYASCLEQMITWFEWCIVNVIQGPVYLGDLELRPSDIEPFPATVHINLNPMLPMSKIAEGQFFSSMWERGHITRTRVQQDGLGIEEATREQRERLLEDVQTALEPSLVMDVLATVVGPSAAGQQTQVSNDMGQASSNGQRVVGPPANTRTGGSTGEAVGGMARAGQPRQPPETAGTLVHAPTG